MSIESNAARNSRIDQVARLEGGFMALGLQWLGQLGWVSASAVWPFSAAAIWGSRSVVGCRPGPRHLRAGLLPGRLQPWKGRQLQSCRRWHWSGYLPERYPRGCRRGLIVIMLAWRRSRWE